MSLEPILMLWGYIPPPEERAEIADALAHPERWVWFGGYAKKASEHGTGTDV